MFDEKRYGLIFRHLVEKKQLKTREVMEICGTSRETARKDLERMQEYGVCKRVHGGAVLTDTLNGYMHVWTDGTDLEWETSRERPASIYDKYDELAAQKNAG